MMNYKIKKLKLTAILLAGLGISTLHAQQSINTTGGDATGSGGSVSYSVGQVAYTAISNSNGSVNQGVQQPYEFYTNSIDENTYISLKMSVYPNPTIAFVTLRIYHPNPENYTFQLYDINGKLLADQKISKPETSVPMENLTAATYFLNIYSNSKALKSFKIIKTK